MFIRECYVKMQGNYVEALRCFTTDAKIRRFLLKFLKDRSFYMLCAALGAKDISEALNAARNLQEVCSTLYLTTLCGSVSVLREALRNRESYSEDLEPLLRKVEDNYTQVISCIGMLG